MRVTGYRGRIITPVVQINYVDLMRKVRMGKKEEVTAREKRAATTVRCGYTVAAEEAWETELNVIRSAPFVLYSQEDFLV
ncbi:MAG: hypothetical protein D3922_03110 [Candidatus Electrothrix sp. AR1]|nr:hypothetical protein [Candidatus Electrothrix sp. AR1]